MRKKISENGLGVLYNGSTAYFLSNFIGNTSWFFTMDYLNKIYYQPYQKKTDTKKNIIYVGEGDNHPGLMRKVLSVKKSQFHNIDDGSDITKFHGLKARIRYRQALQSVQIKRKKSI